MNSVATTKQEGKNTDMTYPLPQDSTIRLARGMKSVSEWASFALGRQRAEEKRRDAVWLEQNAALFRECGLTATITAPGQALAACLACGAEWNVPTVGGPPSAALVCPARKCNRGVIADTDPR